MAVGWIFKCVCGPRLYRVYKTDLNPGKIYEANCLEGYSDNIIRSVGYALSFAWSLAAFASPIIAAFLYRRGFCSLDGVIYLSRLASVVVVVWVGTLCLRGIGRCANTDYLKFIAALENTTKSGDEKHSLKAFDGDFEAWPVDFSWTDAGSILKDRVHVTVPSKKPPGAPPSLFQQIKDLPIRVIVYCCWHSFGKRMMYPGAVKLLQAAIGPMLLEGRAKLMEQHRATRYKLMSRDDNQIDTVFVDRRNSANPLGNILVLCCEGNAGFYEVGIMATPIDAGYSVLGWNHPGFAGSTGFPFPSAEQSAIDVVVQFAFTRLGFKPRQVIVYAWSIGAYTASWACMNYPDIRGLILDATFDDMVPVATSKMPGPIRPFVAKCTAEYFNLNVAEQTNQYNGPVLLYRRTNDEIISTDMSNRLGSNRGNNLLTAILRRRFPNVITAETEWVLREWLSGDRSHQKILYDEQRVDDKQCEGLLRRSIEDSPGYPLELGKALHMDDKIKLILFLAKRYMFDFNSTHCVPLPAAKFQQPWDISRLSQTSHDPADATKARSSSSESDFCQVSEEMCEVEPSNL